MADASSPAGVRGLALIALASVTWGTTGSVTTVLVAHAGATPLVIGAMRMTVAAVLLLAAARVLRGCLALTRGDVARAAALGACMAGFQAAYFTAVTRTGIAVTALLAICSAPVLIAALAVAFLGERPTRRLAAALALGVGGTALLVAGPARPTGAGAAFVGGVLLALLAGLAYALYVVLSKAALARTAPLPLAATTFGAAALVMAPALLDADVPRQLALGWPWLLYLGAVTTAGAYALYTVGLKDVPASAAGIATLFEPLTATTLGVLLFGERLGTAGVAGALLLLASFAVVSSAAARPTRQSAASPRG